MYDKDRCYFLYFQQVNTNTIKQKRLLVFLDGNLSTANTSSSSGSNKTDLLTSRRVTTNGRSLTNMLVITTTVRMFDGVHGNTTHLRPAVPLDLVLVVRTTSLQDGLVNSATTRDDPDHSTVGRGQNFLGARWKLDAGLLRVRVVSNHGCVIARRAGQPSSVSSFLFQVADDGTFGHGANGKYVSNLQSSLSATIDELASVHSFGGKEKLLPVLEPIRVAEHDRGQRSSTTRVVNDFLMRQFSELLNDREL